MKILSLKIVTLTKKKVLAHVFQAYGTLWWKYRLESCHFTNFVPVIFLSRESITFSVCIYFSFELWIDFLFKSSSPHQSRLLISPWQTIGPDHVTLGNTSTPHTKKVHTIRAICRIIRGCMKKEDECHDNSLRDFYVRMVVSQGLQNHVLIDPFSIFHHLTWWQCDGNLRHRNKHITASCNALVPHFTQFFGCNVFILSAQEQKYFWNALKISISAAPGKTSKSQAGFMLWTVKH